MSVTNFIDFQFQISLSVFALGHWTGLKTVLLWCSHGIKLCRAKKHAEAARSSSGFGCCILLFCVVQCAACVRGICDGALPNLASGVHTLEEVTSPTWAPLQPAVASCHTTPYSRPVPQVAPQPLEHPPNLVLPIEVELWLQQPREHLSFGGLKPLSPTRYEPSP